ncbi:unnamed protein product [Clonostachys rosea]|uniref:Uncharacterized protein n=1 Tax=Bionectria ochroleuca TaxID=29856 RepID=A0ABY6UPK2_BIOOC|nr:unnamed protein product [Clonostachys rosea]
MRCPFASTRKAMGRYQLYVALYARAGKSHMKGEEDKYYWAFVVAPKTETNDTCGIRFGVKQVLQRTAEGAAPMPVWVHEQINMQMSRAPMMVGRILIGDVCDVDRLRSILQEVRFRPDIRGWNWVMWMRDAFEELMRQRKVLGRSVKSWAIIQVTAMQYVEEKKAAHRFDGTVGYSMDLTPTWDMLRGVEVTE